MKNQILSITFAIVTIVTGAQNVNLNPDPDGEPWIVGGLRPLTPEDYQMLSRIPQWEPENPVDVRDLPLQVDNTINPWFRPIFSQDGGSCGQASGVGYNFTYEIDYERNVPANVTTNQYPTHFTWNFLNGGVGGGSWYFDGWVIIREAGCPTVATYGGMSYGGQTHWMTGYDKYYDAMFNRTLEIWAIDVDTYEGLEILKQWLWSRDGGTLPGGLANFGAGIGSAIMTTLPAGTPNAGKAVIIQWGNTPDHAMTFVGYDDEIRYDFNNDGQYTTDLDINGDGDVNLQDCEIGGMVMANSWGYGFGNSGKAYVMYKLLADPIEIGGIWSNVVHFVRTKPDPEPMITLKTKIMHTSRNKLKIMAGISSDPSATKPDHVRSFPMFNYQGGDFYMQGGSAQADKTIEIGLDITDLLSFTEPGEEARFFLQVVEQDPDQVGEGAVINCSLIDYTNGAEEVISEMANVPILNSDTTLVWMNKTVIFDKVDIMTQALETAVPGEVYNYQLEAAGGTPPYTWSLQMDYAETQISGSFPAITSNLLQPSNEDDGFVLQTIDFEFPFYGETYHELTILTDGLITFDGIFNYIRDDAAIISNKCITAYCADLMLYPAQGDAMYYEGDTTFATFRWKISKYDDPGFDADIAITLFPDGHIQFFYGNGITPASDWASGISMGDGSNYVISSVSGWMNIPDNFASQMACEPFPAGMQISPDGLFFGVPVDPGTTWNIPFKVTDYNRISSVKTLTFTTVLTSFNLLENHSISLVTISPNPARDMLNITVHESLAGPINISLYNDKGEMIATIPEGSSAMTPGVISCSVNNISAGKLSGLYFIRWQAGEHSGIEKLIILD